MEEEDEEELEASDIEDQREGLDDLLDELEIDNKPSKGHRMHFMDEDEDDLI
jgi:uncharacterized protein YjbK